MKVVLQIKSFQKSFSRLNVSKELQCYDIDHLITYTPIRSALKKEEEQTFGR